ncbi:MAG: hypothetical protein ATN32_06735 [Candidatus Epulonipiscium fishelsonii]|nr:MAG: hypothetical protein ATN32_06735 [Epulopiscium sp. AS2M-Bin002]
MNFLLYVIILITLIFLTKSMLFKLTSKLLQTRNNKYSSRFKNRINLFNVFLIIYLFLSPYAFILLPFLLFCFYMINLILFYCGHIYTKISIALFAVINFLFVDVFILVIVSTMKNCTVLDILTNPELHMLCYALLLITLNVIFIILMGLVPSSYFKKIGQSLDNSSIFLLLELLMIVVMLSNSWSCYMENFSDNIMIQRVIHCVFWLVVLYAAIYIMIYLEKNKEHSLYLQNSLKLNNMLHKTFADDREVFLQIDCTTDEIILITSSKWNLTNYMCTHYSQLMTNFLIYNHIHSDYIDDFLKLTTTEHMLNTFFYGQNKYNFEFQVTEQNTAKHKWLKMDVFLEADESISEHTLAVIIMSDITKDKELQFQAERDQLTSLYNKSITAHLINQRIQQKQKGILFMIDCDYFKQVNDTLGHDVGDKVIVDIANTISNIFAPYSKEETIIGRVGGDEFMAFVVPNNNKFNISEIAEKACSQLSQTYSNSVSTVSTSASIGIAEVNESIASFSELYLLADAALYESKNNGRNQFTIYNSSLNLHI